MSSDAKAPDGFSLRRWSRRKLEAAREEAVKQPAAPTAAAPATASVPEATVAPPVAAEAALPPVESLTPQSDFTVFMRPEVDDGLKRQALKKLFADPHFNVMDGLDIYIDDYTKPDPIPASVLERLTQSGFVRGLGAPRPDEPASASAPNVPGTDVAPREAPPPEAPEVSATDAASTDPAPDAPER
jgi:Protein of unknown function (DUF3306)